MADQYSETEGKAPLVPGAQPEVGNSLTPNPVHSPGMLADELARLPEKTILDEAALARLLGVSTRSIRRMVNRFELPPSIRMAGRAVWLSGRVLAYIEDRIAKTEREAERMQRKITQSMP